MAHKTAFKITVQTFLGGPHPVNYRVLAEETKWLQNQNSIQKDRVILEACEALKSLQEYPVQDESFRENKMIQVFEDIDANILHLNRAIQASKRTMANMTEIRTVFENGVNFKQRKVDLSVAESQIWSLTLQNENLQEELQARKEKITELKKQWVEAKDVEE